MKFARDFVLQHPVLTAGAVVALWWWWSKGGGGFGFANASTQGMGKNAIPGVGTYPTLGPNTGTAQPGACNSYYRDENGILNIQICGDAP